MSEHIKVGDKVLYKGNDEPESGLVGVVREDEHRPVLGVQFFSEREDPFLSGFFEHELEKVDKE